MGVPTSGDFNMFGTATTASIAGAIEAGGSNVSSITTFEDLIAASTASLFDSTYSGTISSLSDVSASLQYRNYPTAIVATTNTFGNGVNGAAPIYPMLNLGGGSLWNLTLSSTSGIFSITDYQVNYANTNTTSGNTNSQPLNMSGTSTLSEIYFIIQGNNTPTGGIDGFSSLKITDGTNNYNGVGTEEYVDKFRVTFNIGSAKGRTFYWGQATSATIGVLEIEDNG